MSLLGCAVGLAFGATLLLFVAGVFVPAMQAQFGWSRSQISSVSLFVVLVSIPLAPLVGLAVDRWGVRVCGGIGMVGIALGFVAFSHFNGDLAGFAAIYVVMAVFALGATPISFTRPINAHFDAGRGLALGLALSATGVTAFLAPRLVAEIISTRGWRTAYLLLAAAVALATPIMMLLVRPVTTPSRVSAPAPVKDKLPAATMIKDPTFVRLGATFLLIALGTSGFTLHLSPLLIDRGLKPVAAAGVQSLIGVGLIAGRLGSGAAVDRFFAPWVAAFLLLATAAGLAAMAIFGLPAASIFALAIGFALGIEGDLIGYLCARYYGMSHYGQRFGTLYGAYLLANGLSPLLIALLAERFGGYPVALWTCFGFVCAAISLLATAPPFPAKAAGWSKTIAGSG